MAKSQDKVVVPAAKLHERYVQKIRLAHTAALSERKGRLSLEDEAYLALAYTPMDVNQLEGFLEMRGSRARQDFQEVVLGPAKT